MAVGDENCKECFGLGIVEKNGVYKRCKHCLTLSINDLDRDTEIPKSEVWDKLRDINAPEYVKDDDFDYNGELLLKDRSIPREERKGVDLNTYVSGLTELNEWSKSGVKLPYSYFISSKRGYSKSALKWSVIKNYLGSGYTVSKVLSTEDIINLKVKNDVKSIEEYDEYFSNDLIILDLTGSISNPRLNIISMVEVLEKCGRMNKPLICFTNFSKDNIVERGRDIGSIFKNSRLTKGKYDEFKVIEYVNDTENEEFSFKKNR